MSTTYASVRLDALQTARANGHVFPVQFHRLYDGNMSNNCTTCGAFLTVERDKKTGAWSVDLRGKLARRCTPSYVPDMDDSYGCCDDDA